MTPYGADLHLHTVYSDGAYTPETLVAEAVAQNLKTIAVTDHDSMRGVAPTRTAAEGKPLEVLCGVEFGTSTEDTSREELHIVGLFLNETHEELLATLEDFRAKRVDRVKRMVEKLNKIGIPLRERDVFDLAGEGNVGRLHVAKALVNAGHARGIQSAFQRWLRGNGAAYVARQRPPVEETIALIHRAGGIAVMAHPGVTNRDDEIPQLAEAGLDAIEIYSAEHDAGAQTRYIEMAKRYGLDISGGSDCHGENKERLTIGKVRVSDAELAALRRRAERYRE